MASNLDVKLSPHTLQNKDSKYVQEAFGEANRILNDDYPSNVEYKPKEKEDDLTVVHNGRRQLLLNEIEFLTLALKSLKEKHGSVEELKKKKFVVIYAGAAVGLHLKMLSQFFPFMKFILYDKKRFSLSYGDKKYEKFIEIKKEYLNAELANSLRNEYKDEDNWIRLFISDIRRTNDTEPQIEEDTDLQADIHRALQPFKSYLKFRLPYPNHKKEKTYLDGTIYFLAYGNRSTTETRLLVDRDAKEKVYDCTKYENQLFYFNKFDRTNCYAHDIRVNGLDHCYDCRTEVYIIDKYGEVYDLVDELSEREFMEPLKQTLEYIKMINKSFFNDTKIEYALNFENKFYSGKYLFTSLGYGTRIDLAFLMRLKRSTESSHRNSNPNIDSLTGYMGRLNINQRNNRNGIRNRNSADLSWKRNEDS